MTTCTLDADLLALLDLGASIVRVAPRDKIPLGRSWNTLATTDADTIAGWLDTGHNIGLLCGSSGLIDIEYDDPAGRATLAALGLLDAETPTWVSHRGEHRLFRIEDPLPPWGWKKFAGVEIRFGGKPAQSVLPPSTHPTGVPYHWLVSPQQCEPVRIALSHFENVARNACFSAMNALSKKPA